MMSIDFDNLKFFLSIHNKKNNRLELVLSVVVCLNQYASIDFQVFQHSIFNTAVISICAINVQALTFVDNLL